MQERNLQKKNCVEYTRSSFLRLLFIQKNVYFSPASPIGFFIILSTAKNPTIRNRPIARQIAAFCTKPAIMKQTKLIAATVIAYGSCVDTWFT